jgi:tetratricopeptide (TPR) repeat protein
MSSKTRTDDEIIALLQEASGSMRTAQFEAALRVFQDILAETNPNVEKFAASVQGMMGECLFSLARIPESIEVTQKAIALSQADNDDEGVVTALVSLYEAYRYAGQAQEAIKVCEQLSTLFTKLGSATSSANYEKQAKILAKGEPLNRVVAVVDGQNYELDELSSAQVSLKNKSVQFNFLRNRLALPPSKYYCNIAAEQQAKGEYASAAINLRKATALDVYDPEPWYNLGVVLLHQERPDEALVALKKCAELAPGWLDVNHMIWVAQAMNEAKFDLQIFQALYVLEHGRLATPQRIAACEKLLTQGQKYPALMLHLGMAYQQVSGKMETAESAFRGGLLLTDNLDDDIKTRLLFNLAVCASSPEEKDKLLHECKSLAGNLTAAAMATATLALS